MHRRRGGDVLVGGLMVALALAWMFLAGTLTGCTEDNPARCDTHEECRTAAAAGEIPSEYTVCHQVDGVCHAPCDTDSDCKGTDWLPGLVCHRGQCMPTSAVDGGVDGSADQSAADAGADGPATDATNLQPGEACDERYPEQCAEGHCVDGVCCTTACDGTCERCDVDTLEGTCTAVEEGADPDSECTGHLACGGECDGAGACRFDEEAVCKTACTEAGAGPIAVHKCQADGTCEAEASGEEPCAFSRCTEADDTATCSGICQGHADCQPGSVCDRRQVHATGAGACVDPTRVKEADNDEELDSILSNLEAASLATPPVVALKTPTGGKYLTKKTIQSGTAVMLVGLDDDVNFDPPSGDDAFTVEKGATLVLQGVTVEDDNAADGGGIGVKCGETSTQSKLTVVESTVAGQTLQGIVAANCDVTVRRSRISLNVGGGLKLDTGTFVLTNNVIDGNGTAASQLGGVQLSGDPVTFEHNTVVNNSAREVSAAGVICSQITTLHNSILWGNRGSGEHFGCSFEHSDVQGLEVGGSTNISEDPQLDATTRKPSTTSPVIDQIPEPQTGGLHKDHEITARLKGSAADMGAYEVR